MRRFKYLAVIFMPVLFPVPAFGKISTHDSLQITQIPPAVASIVPSNTQAGGPPFTLLVNGSNFNETSIVQWNGVNRPTNYMGSTSLTAMISADDIASAGIIAVSVFNPFPGGGISNPMNFRVNNPAPMILGLNPDSATAGGRAFNLVVNGVNFVPLSTVQWNGMNRPTTFISNMRLSAMISAVDLETATSANITVMNPEPGGGASAAAPFHTDHPVPSISYVNPASAIAAGIGFPLSVYGDGYMDTSTVQWNGNGRNTVFISRSQLTALIYASDIAAGGTASVTVMNPAPGGGVSNSRPFTIMTIPKPPSATGAAVPSSVKAGESILLLVRVVPGSDPASTGIHVLTDLTAIGGSPNQQLYDDGTHGDATPGDNSFAVRATVSASSSNGKKSLPVAVRDAQGRSASTTIQLAVGPAKDSSPPMLPAFRR